MGARPSSFKKGGGFLNNVDGVILGYEFTTTFPGSDGKRESKSDFNPLYAVLSAKVDGADEEVSTTLFVGDADSFSIEDGGKTLVPTQEGYELSANAEWSKLITSLCENGDGKFSEEDLPEETINYEAIVGLRVRFIQVDVVGRDGKVKTKVSKKDKKTYNVTSPQIAKVYGRVEAGKKGAAWKATAGKSTGKPAGKSAKTAAPSVKDEAEAALAQVLEKSGGSIAKAKLRMKLLSLLTGKTDNRDEVIKFLYNDDNLAGIEGIEYDPTDKAQTISVA